MRTLSFTISILLALSLLIVLAEAAQFCPQCGVRNLDSSNYCTSCGAALSEQGTASDLQTGGGSSGTTGWRSWSQNMTVQHGPITWMNVRPRPGATILHSRITKGQRRFGNQTFYFSNESVYTPNGIVLSLDQRAGAVDFMVVPPDDTWKGSQILKVAAGFPPIALDPSVVSGAGDVFVSFSDGYAYLWDVDTGTARLHRAPETSASPSPGASCFVATAAFDSSMEKHVTILKNFRDAYLLPYAFGRILVRIYNEYSPPLAHFIAKHEILKPPVRIGLMPLVAISYSTLHFGPVITLTTLVIILVTSILLVSFYRRRTGTTW